MFCLLCWLFLLIFCSIRCFVQVFPGLFSDVSILFVIELRVLLCSCPGQTSPIFRLSLQLETTFRKNHGSIDKTQSESSPLDCEALDNPELCHYISYTKRCWPASCSVRFLPEENILRLPTSGRVSALSLAKLTKGVFKSATFCTLCGMFHS